MLHLQLDLERFEKAYYASQNIHRGVQGSSEQFTLNRFVPGMDFAYGNKANADTPAKASMACTLKLQDAVQKDSVLLSEVTAKETRASQEFDVQLLLDSQLVAPLLLKWLRSHGFSHD